MDGKTTGIVALVLIIILGAWYLMTRPAAAPSPAADTTIIQTTTNSTTTTSGTAVRPTASVTLTSKGFSPQTLTVAPGTTVTFVSQVGSDMWVASAPHPTHQGYDGTTRDQHCAAGYQGPAPFDQCAEGSSFSFTFDKVGSWKYHNHSNSSMFGTIIVAQPTSSGATSSVNVQL